MTKSKKKQGNTMIHPIFPSRVESRKKRCQFLDEDGNRCYRSTCRTRILFLDEKLQDSEWIAVDLCDLHSREAHPVMREREGKIQ
jgi:hypothetical protein